MFMSGAWVLAPASSIVPILALASHDVPILAPTSPVIQVLTSASPITPVIPSVGKPFKFILASSKRIAGWFGVKCEDCPNGTIWGCYVTKSCWKVVIVALGVVFLFIAFLMGLFFLGQIDDLLKYQKQLIEYEKAYPTLARVMITPLKLFHKGVTKSYARSMKSLTRKFGKKPWFKFVVVLPCKCLRGTWTIFQKILQTICFFSCTASSKTKNCIMKTGLVQWTSDAFLKKVGCSADSIGDAKREKKLKKKTKEDEKQAKLDAKQAKIDEREAKKQTKIEEKLANISEKEAERQAKRDERQAKKEARKAAREAIRETKMDAKEAAEEAKREAEEVAEEAKWEAEEATEDAKKEAEEKVAEKLEVSKVPLTSPTPLLPLPSPPPPPPPPPSPAPPMAIVPLGMSPIMPMALPTMSSTMPMAPPTMPMAPPAMPNQQLMYGAPAQQYVDPYATQQYGGMTQQYVVDPYGGYGAPLGQGYGAFNNPIYGAEQFGMYGNDPMYAQQEGTYGQDQYGIAAPEQQTIAYGYNPNVVNAQDYGGQYYA